MIEAVQTLPWLDVQKNYELNSSGVCVVVVVVVVNCEGAVFAINI